jgi:hypothetical protein
VISAAFSLLPDDPDSAGEELAAWRKGMQRFEPEFADEITSISGWAAARMFADALKAAGPDRQAIIDHLAQQSAYDFGGLQGPANYTDGSKPNPCTLRLVLKDGKFVRADSAPEPPEFNCGPVLDAKTGEVVQEAP